MDSAVGIDLGTTYSGVGVYKHGKVEMVPLNTVFDAKSLIGCKFDDPTVQSGINSGEGAKPKVQVESKIVTPEEISSMGLSMMKTSADAFLGSTVKDAVITVPSYVSDLQRQATKEAGAISGLKVLRIIDEPTAVAYAYAFNMLGRGKRNIVILDLNSHEISCRVVSVEDLLVNVKSLLKKAKQGGEYLTDVLMNNVMSDLNKKYLNKWWCDADTFSRIRSACKRTIHSLCRLKESTIYLKKIRKDDELCRTISRELFSSWIGNSLKSMMDMVNETLGKAKMDNSLINDVLFVGEYSKLPMYQDVISDMFSGKKLNESINPDEAVAYGAAVKAAILSGDKLEDAQDRLPLDVAPHTLSIETKDNKLFGKFELSAIPPATRGVLQIEVTFDTDVNGILNASAIRKQNKVTSTNAKERLTEEDVERMVNESRRVRIKAKNTLETYTNYIKQTFDEKLKKKISPEDKKEVEDKFNEIFEWLGSNQNAEKEEFELLEKDLDKLAKPIIYKHFQSAGGAPPGAGAPGAAGGAGGPAIEVVD